MSQRSGLQFAEAQPHHLKAIVEIHNSHVRRPSNSDAAGFLLAQTSEAEILENLGRSTQYFVAVNGDETILGFLAVSQPKISDEFLKQIIWIDDDCQEKILSDRHFYLKIVAIKAGWMGKGIAQFLYHSLYQNFPNTFISAFVVTQPIRNERSIVFHQKQGFSPVGTFQQKQFLDLQNYESLLMLKIV